MTTFLTSSSSKPDRPKRRAISFPGGVAVALFAAVAAPAAAQEPAEVREACIDGRAGDDPNGLPRARACTMLILAEELFSPRDRALAHMRRGEVFASRHWLVQALQSYDAAIELVPDMAEAFIGRAGVRSRLGQDRSLVLADFEEAIRLDPGNATIFNNRALVGGGSGAERRADFDTAIRLGPDKAVHFNNRGFERATRGDHEGAVSDFSRAIELEPTVARYFTQRGRSWLALGADQRAIDDFTQAIRIGPPAAANHNGRGVGHERLGMSEEALSDYREAIRLFPSHIEARERLCALAARLQTLSESDRSICAAQAETARP